VRPNEIVIKKLDPKRFNVLVGASRSPAAAYVSEELEWYVNEEETIIAVLLYDTVDADFCSVLMARDEGDRFCAFDVEAAFSTPEAAKSWLVNGMKWHTGSGLKMYPKAVKPKGQTYLHVFCLQIGYIQFLLFSRMMRRSSRHVQSSKK
jgi:hypothetical protein